MLTPERVKEIRKRFAAAMPLGECLTDLELSALLNVWEAANEWLMSEDETALRKALGRKE